MGISDIPRDIKVAADFTGGIPVLDFVSLFLWISFTLSAVFSSRLFAFYNYSLQEAEKRKQEEMAIQEMRMRAEEVRLLQEMHALVHDLKTPLMTIQGLSSLLGLATENAKVQEYCGKIAASVDNVNEMVSEILYDDVRKVINVSDFLNYVRAHALVKFQGQQIYFKIEDELPLITVNRIRMARVFTNLIQNAFAATGNKSNGFIEVIAKQQYGDVLFTIKDNGVGISKEDLEDIWRLGFSKKNSSGLGLNFVKNVVESHSGSVTIKSKVGEGTLVEILLPGGKING